MKSKELQTDKRTTDKITPRYFVILYLSWNSVTSLVWCRFRLQILTKKSILDVVSLKSLITQENWYLNNKVTFLPLLLSSFDFHVNFFCSQICSIVINFFAKFHRNLLQKFEVIAYLSNWTFFGSSQFCQCFLNMPNKQETNKGF